METADQEKPPLSGLTGEEAVRRREEGKGNDYKLKTSRSYKEIIKDNLFTFFNFVLFILGILLVALGQASEALITTGVVFINVIIAMFQEIEAKKKLDKIALLTKPMARVIRDGEEKEIDPAEIVLGDILSAGPGDQIPVDGILIEGQTMDVDESLLTGESDPIHKKGGDEVLSGSFCVAGSAFYEAKKVGTESFINRITSDAKTFKKEYTPLQKEINLIIRILVAVIFFFAVLLTLRSILEERTFLESVRMVSVLFGMAPSSLFLMIVVAYALGAVRIANKGALVQQANSVESICNVDVLCLDKTGTITSNRIKYESIKILKEDVSEDQMAFILGCYARSSSASNATSEAIEKECNGKKLDFSQEVPFSSALKWSGLSFDAPELKGTYVLGAPEILENHTAIGEGPQRQLQEWADMGLRVLLFIYNPEAVSLADEEGSPRIPRDMIPLCLICFSDELRPNVMETLEQFSHDGIKVKIISGDNPKTVTALAKQAGIGKGEKSIKMISGPELEKMDQEDFENTVLETTIFGRITPQQKERIVKALRHKGGYVAMIGDGVNDVLALKQANLGIAMQSGSQATRNVAGMVLLNDSFSSLPVAIKEGQRILNGMKDIFKLYMTRIMYLTFLISAISIIGAGFPFTPKQSSIISILTLSIPSFALALWAKPGKPGKGTMTRKMLHFALPAVVTLTIAGLFTYLYFLIRRFIQSNIVDIEYAQYTLTYTTIICGILLIIFAEPPTRTWTGGDDLSGDWRPTILAFTMFIIFVLFIVIPRLKNFYSMIYLRNWADYLVIASISFLWAIGLRFTWRKKLVDRYLDIDLKGC